MKRSSQLEKTKRSSQLELGFIDFAAVLFVVGGVASLVMNLLTIPFVSFAPVAFTTVFFVVLIIGLVCSLGAVYCYVLAARRMLSEAGIRGMICGALLLIFGFGFVATFNVAATATYLSEISAVLVLIGGIICFVLRHTALSSSPMMRQEPIPQPA
jgi:hypothetical protein